MVAFKRRKNTVNTYNWHMTNTSLHNSTAVEERCNLFKPQIILHSFEGQGCDSRFLKSMVLRRIRAQAGPPIHWSWKPDTIGCSRAI